ncbi:histidine phosphatase family protein [Chondrinema litorale]|uniref:histidine phosphatase family protein n=1 Tax=Chondrinema litorale TaxID=2994555 RepID=UPI002542D182|nr:histidine phosphatase family protein [Chondrinema litorale]UZR95394.1 histidine phosphatase family protein [Chondrinema litorale]
MSTQSTAQNHKELEGLREYYKNQSLDSCIIPYRDSTKIYNQIILIRHGQPDVSKKGWRNREGAKLFVKMYDSVGVLAFTPLPVCPEDFKENKVYHSNIPRAVNTASRIFADRYDMIENDRFREFERKIFPFFNIKMPLSVWLTVSRGLWFLGLNDKGIENFKEARKRAKSNAEFLAEEADKEQLVIVVAHGLHNKYVAKYLKRLGWDTVRKGGSSYTAVNILARLDE